jgi:hypothetical protein
MQSFKNGDVVRYTAGAKKKTVFTGVYRETTQNGYSSIRVKMKDGSYETHIVPTESLWRVVKETT